MYNHFKTNNNTEEDQESIKDEEMYLDNDSQNNLNAAFTPEEINNCIQSLKNNKAPGIDNVINEYITCTRTKLLPIYVDIFNII